MLIFVMFRNHSCLRNAQNYNVPYRCSCKQILVTYCIKGKGIPSITKSSLENIISPLVNTYDIVSLASFCLHFHSETAKEIKCWKKS